MNVEELDQIEKYIFKKLGGEELLLFENKLTNDAAFKEKVERHAAIISNLRFYGERTVLRNKLVSFQEEIDKESKVEKNIFSLSKYVKRHKTTIAVAASVALISVTSTFFTVNYVNSLEQNQHAYYKELKREITNIKSSQKKINNNRNESGVIADDLKTGATGFLISQEGYVLTSLHVVKDGGKIFLENERFGMIKAKLISKNELHDLAVLKVENDIDFKKLPISFVNDQTSIGEKVFTLGFPKDDVVYGEGSLSSMSGYESDSTSYQISVPVNPGNSGSPLYNDKGQIIGMVSGKQSGAEGASFALKAEYIKNLILEDSLNIKLPVNPLLKGKSRSAQLNKLKDCVFAVKVYKK